MSHLRRVLRIAAWSASLIVSAGTACVFWWNAWMYRGWPGSPGIVARLLHADGEAAYDANALEMFLIALAVFAAARFSFVRWRRAA